jgi:hypothetical protein
VDRTGGLASAVDADILYLALSALEFMARRMVQLPAADRAATLAVWTNRAVAIASAFAVLQACCAVFGCSPRTDE